mmetsp:Transcript_6505/g.14227  ORF Transcript_6505/g.14227 Transcript_6505/m.14227 type:complete len:161 (-) Transcript_6505:53-535(-)
MALQPFPRMAARTRLLDVRSSSGRGWAALCAEPTLSSPVVPAFVRYFSKRPNRGMTDAQIEEIRKYDPFLAEQIRTAEAKGINAVDWRTLEAMPVVRSYPASSAQSLDSGSGKNLRLAAGKAAAATAKQAAAASDGVGNLVKSAKDTAKETFWWLYRAKK